MDLLTVEQLLSKQSRKFEVVDVPDVGPMRFGSLTAGPALEYGALERRRDAGEVVDKELALHILTHSCVDGVGRPMFTPERARQFLENNLSPAALMFIVELIGKLNGGPKEKPEGNPSEASPSSGSHTGSA